MLERLYDCLTALQQQYELNREDGLYWQQTAQTTATQLAMTGEAPTAHACQVHGNPADSLIQNDRQEHCLRHSRCRAQHQCKSRVASTDGKAD